MEDYKTEDLYWMLGLRMLGHLKLPQLPSHEMLCFNMPERLSRCMAWQRSNSAKLLAAENSLNLLLSTLLMIRRAVCLARASFKCQSVDSLGAEPGQVSTDVLLQPMSATRCPFQGSSHTRTTRRPAQP